MRSLSDEARALIARLTPSWRESSVGRLFPVSFSTARLIEKVAALGEVAAIPYLRNYALSDNRTLCDAALAAVRELLTRLRPRDFVWLDRHMRDSWLMSYQWHESLTPSRVSTVAPSAGLRSTFLGLASTHASGYVREVAVRLLGDTESDGLELPFLLVRCNDWVEQVRAAATAAVQQRLSPSSTPHFVQCYGLVKWLESCGRTTPGGLARQIDEWLIRPHAHAQLVKALDSSDSFVRRGCFDLLLAGGSESISTLVERVSKSTDAVLRLKAVSAAARTLERQNLQECLLAYSDDPSMPVRRDALVVLAGRFSELATPLLERAILDRHASLREIARAHLRRRLPGRDFRAEYEAALKSTSGWKLTAAIGGLGECGKPSDEDLLVPFLEGGLPRDRRAALRGLKRLDSTKWVPHLIAAIADPSPSVSRTSRQLLRRSLPSNRIDEVFWLLEKIEHRHGIRHLLSLIAEQHTWRAAYALVAACSRADSEVAEYAMALLQGWVSIPYLPSGTKGEIQAVLDLLRARREALPKVVAESLAFMLRTASR